ncbi:MAG: hypothetical protein JWM68_1175, partial [Verrucomicrobiales bacterium]|nr:hypothetical protein [Verrucomicrobiales bacterium]
RLRNGNSAIGVAQTVYGMEIPQSASPRPFTEWKFRNQRRPGRLRNGNSAISVAQAVYGMETPQSASPRPFTERKLYEMFCPPRLWSGNLTKCSADSVFEREVSKFARWRRFPGRNASRSIREGDFQRGNLDHRLKNAFFSSEVCSAAPIPKGLRPKAQGCPAEREATLGKQRRHHQPQRDCVRVADESISSDATPLGLNTNTTSLPRVGFANHGLRDGTPLAFSSRIFPRTVRKLKRIDCKLRWGTILPLLGKRAG